MTILHIVLVFFLFLVPIFVRSVHTFSSFVFSPVPPSSFPRSFGSEFHPWLIWGKRERGKMPHWDVNSCRMVLPPPKKRKENGLGLDTKEENLFLFFCHCGKVSTFTKEGRERMRNFFSRSTHTRGRAGGGKKTQMRIHNIRK